MAHFCRYTLDGISLRHGWTRRSKRLFGTHGLVELLSPVILLLGWGNVKETAAVSALFIWVNSLAGLLGQIQSGIEVAQDIYLLLGLAIVGGIFGATLGSKKLSFTHLNWILSAVLILASVKLLFL